MKNYLSLIAVGALFIGVLVFSGCTPGYPSDLSVYSFDTAVIQYDLSGATEGDMTVYIRGDQKAIQKFVTTAGQEENSMELDLGAEKYIVDLDKMTAVKAENKDYQVLLDMSPEEQTEFMVKKALGLKDSTETPKSLTTSVVAGQTCDVYQVSNLGTACIWNGLVLQKEISLLDITNKTTATSVKINTPIVAERFELPAGVTVK